MHFFDIYWVLIKLNGDLYFLSCFFAIFVFFLAYNCKKMPFPKSKCQKQWLILIENFISYNMKICNNFMTFILKDPWILSSNDIVFWSLSWTLSYIFTSFSRLFGCKCSISEHIDWSVFESQLLCFCHMLTTSSTSIYFHDEGLLIIVFIDLF